MDFLLNKRLNKINFKNTLFNVPYNDKIDIINLFIEILMNKDGFVNIFNSMLNRFKFTFTKSDLNYFIEYIDKKLETILLKYIPEISIDTINNFFVFNILLNTRYGSYYYIKQLLYSQFCTYDKEIKDNITKDILISLYNYREIKVYKYKNFNKIKDIIKRLEKYIPRNKIYDNFNIDNLKNIFTYEMKIKQLFTNKNLFYRYLILIERLNLMSNKNLFIKKNLFSRLAIKIGNCKNLLTNIFSFYYQNFCMKEYEYESYYISDNPNIHFSGNNKKKMYCSTFLSDGNSFSKIVIENGPKKHFFDNYFNIDFIKLERLFFTNNYSIKYVPCLPRLEIFKRIK